MPRKMVSHGSNQVPPPSINSTISPATYPPRSYFQGQPMNSQLFPSTNLAPYDPMMPTMNSLSALVEQHMDQMMNRMNSMFGSSMGMFMQPSSFGFMHPPSLSQAMTSDPNAKTYMMSKSQTVEYSNLNGKPKLVQSHDEREMGPNGVWRQRRAHRDTSKGIEQMQEGLFIGDQGEIRERYRNPQTGALEDRRYHRNVPEEYKVNFVNEWNRKAEEAKQMFREPFRYPNQQYLQAPPSSSSGSTNM
ncbi:hypothetical protein ACOME3_001059 [Neoechinorhynchus agilis]